MKLTPYDALGDGFGLYVSETHLEINYTGHKSYNISEDSFGHHLSHI